ncbi:MAG: magnesium transporter [Anaerococcus sp.]|nr:magnesium transporter [Anaerococcus sp.]
MMDEKFERHEIDMDLLNKYLEDKDYLKLKNQIQKYNPVDITDYIESLDLKSAMLVFRLLNKDDSIDVFSHMEKDHQTRLLEAFSDKEVKFIVDELYFDDMIDLIEEMPAGIVKKVLRHTDKSERNLINQFLNYPEDSAGSLMTIEYIELRSYYTVRKALEVIKKTGVDKQTVYTCFVTNEKKTLLGFISLRTIVTNEPETLIEDLMDEDVIYVHTDDDQETVADVFKKYGFVVLPVVDNEKRLTGIITVDDIMEVMEQETTEDFQRMAGTTPDEEEYSNTSALKLAKNRLPWLMFLMISASFTSTILKSSQRVIESIIALNMFIPMLTDSGGNAGSQSSTLVIRGMATGDVELEDWYKVVLKEFEVGVIVGIVMSLLAFFKCLLFDKVALEVAGIVAITIFVIIIIAKVVGALLPMGAKKLGFDPAIMASPLITTIVDSIGLICYFEVAKIIMGI